MRNVPLCVPVVEWPNTSMYWSKHCRQLPPTSSLQGDLPAGRESTSSAPEVASLAALAAAAPDPDPASRASVAFGHAQRLLLLVLRRPARVCAPAALCRLAVPRNDRQTRPHEQRQSF